MLSNQDRFYQLSREFLPSDDFGNQLNHIKILSVLGLHHFDVLGDNGMITGQPFFPHLALYSRPFRGCPPFQRPRPSSTNLSTAKRVQGSVHLAIPKLVQFSGNIFPEFVLQAGNRHGDNTALFHGTE